MTPSEATTIVTTLRNMYGRPGQPAWDEPGVLQAWFDALTPFQPPEAYAAMEELAERNQDRFLKGDPVYFPAPIEFAAMLRRVATDSEREAVQRDALVAAIRCDGSRFIDNSPDALGNRPFPALGAGLVACPTCNPSLHKRQAGGNLHRPTPKGEPAAPTACRSEPDTWRHSPEEGARWGRVIRALDVLPPGYRHELEATFSSDGANLLRAEAFLTALGEQPDAAPPRRRVRVGRPISDIEVDAADTTPHPEDSARKCPWCGAPVKRTQVEGWWRCGEMHMATTAQIDAGAGGGR